MSLLDWLDPDYDHGKVKRAREADLRAAQRHQDALIAEVNERGHFFKWLVP